MLFVYKSFDLKRFAAFNTSVVIIFLALDTSCNSRANTWLWLIVPFFVSSSGRSAPLIKYTFSPQIFPHFAFNLALSIPHSLSIEDMPFLSNLSSVFLPIPGSDFKLNEYSFLVILKD